MPVVSPPSSTSSAGHTHLLSHYYGINGDTPDEQDSPTTILSRQFNGTQSLFEVAARLADGKDLLNNALTTITDKNATTKQVCPCWIGGFNRTKNAKHPISVSSR
jgi:hypothetical protein